VAGLSMRILRSQLRLVTAANLLVSSVLLAAVVASVLPSVGCGTPSAMMDTTTPATVTVTISTASKTVTVGKTLQFTATVQNASNTAVTWQVNSVTGGNSTSGTISTSGLYAAPATVPNPATVTVTAISQADSTKSASAQVTITTTPAVVSITISPTSANVTTGATQQFTATVQNASNTAVTWQVNSVTGGNSTSGTISTSGLYTAPATLPNPATVTVTAISQADSTKSASAQVTISTVNIAGFYVSTTGNDSNPGTIDSPWRTIQHAANSVQAGDTVYVRSGVYSEVVTIAVSGSAGGGPITFQNYPGETAVVDGSGLAVPSSGTQGLFNIANQSYITIEGFEIRNYQTANASATPAGIWISGSGSNIRIQSNIVHDIVTTSEQSGNAFGIAVYGTATTSLDSITIDSNQVYNLRTGNSESVNVDGNVTDFAITNNIVHDNDNIGIDAIGFEGVAPSPSVDFARNGEISGNTIYNISAINNPGEGNEYDADGIYVDGGAQITVERNRVYQTDLGIEVASEHAGHVASSVIVRNNLVYHSNSVGISIGGYASNVGGTDKCSIVNNTLFENDTQNTGSGEFQVQYYATNNIFENNIVYATAQGLFINNFTTSEPNPVTADYNLYYSSLNSSTVDFIWNGTSQTGFGSYQSATGMDSHSQYADPQFLSLTTPDLRIEATSPAVNRGNNNLGPVVGTLDFAGNPRTHGSTIDVGAYEQ